MGDMARLKGGHFLLFLFFVGRARPPTGTLSRLLEKKITTTNKREKVFVDEGDRRMSERRVTSGD